MRNCIACARDDDGDAAQRSRVLRLRFSRSCPAKRTMNSAMDPRTCEHNFAAAEYFGGPGGLIVAS